MTAEQIITELHARVATLTQERDEFMTQANLQIAAMGGALQELGAMLKHIQNPPEGAVTPPEPPAE